MTVPPVPSVSTVSLEETAQSTQPRPEGETPLRRRGNRLLVWTFLAPTLVGLGLFSIVPIIGSVVLAFFHWDIITPPEWAGWDNFAELASNPAIRISFLNTLLFVVLAVTVQLSVALGLAIMVQSRMPNWLRTFFRSALFLPLVLSAASVSLVMAYLFNQEFGLVNEFLAALGIAKVGWLTTGLGAKTVVLLVFVWQNFGFSFLLFLGGLSAIPREVYEASSIDGAKGLRQFRAITLPLVSPTLLVASVMAIISALQVFDQPYVLTRGGPGNETRTAVMVIYESAFRELEFGLASAVGIILTLLIMLVTGIQFWLSKRFVFYG